MILVIDNYDSFTFNLVQALQASGADIRVVRNDAMTAEELEAMAADPASELHGIVISPGPGTPATAGISIESVGIAARHRVPLLGVCLGMQSMAAAYGGAIVRAPTLVHGESSAVTHDGAGLLTGLPPDFQAARYHSLCVDAATLPPELHVTAMSNVDGVVMGLRHETLPMEGVQFHPESVLTPDGPHLLANFLRLAGDGEASRLDAATGSFATHGMAERDAAGDEALASRRSSSGAGGDPSGTPGASEGGSTVGSASGSGASGSSDASGGSSPSGSSGPAPITAGVRR